MNANVYQLDGKQAGEISLPAAFTRGFRQDLVMRAIAAEQSTSYQPQGHYLFAGLQTTAVYVGRYDAHWRTGRHRGMAIRPRQKLGGGAQGNVRRIPSAVKGRRAHPHKIEKNIIEKMNRKEYISALEAAMSGAADASVVKSGHTFEGKVLPIIIEDKIEGIGKTKELLKVLDALGLQKDLSRSHEPRLRKGTRSARKRRFRNSILIIARDPSKVEKAGRNIPGVRVCSASGLSVGRLAPGGKPVITVWSEGAIKEVDSGLQRSFENNMSA